MERRTNTYPAKIAPYLLLATLLLAGQAQRASFEVNGIVGGTVLLPVIVPGNPHVEEGRWKFGSTGPEKVRLGDSKGRTFVPNNRSYTNYSQLIQRLDMFNETTLRIRNLTKSDGGVYEADVEFSNGNVRHEEFQVKVYDPVPIPHIETRSLVYTSDGCNVTLVCTAGDATNISWAKVNHTGAFLQMQNNFHGEKLHLSINTQTSTNVTYKYFCLATNPVEQKNASITDVCPMRPQQRSRAMVYFFIPIIVSLAVIGAICVLWRRKKKKKMEKKPEDDKAVYSLASHAQEEMTECPSYTRRPPDGDEVTSHLKDDRRNLQQKETETNTIYVEVQPTWDNVLA